MVDAEPDHVVHAALPSIMPLVTAAATAAMIVACIFYALGPARRFGLDRPCVVRMVSTHGSRARLRHRGARPLGVAASRGNNMIDSNELAVARRERFAAPRTGLTLAPLVGHRVVDRDRVDLLRGAVQFVPICSK